MNHVTIERLADESFLSFAAKYGNPTFPTAIDVWHYAYRAGLEAGQNEVEKHFTGGIGSFSS